MKTDKRLQSHPESSKHNSKDEKKPKLQDYLLYRLYIVG